MNRVRLLPEHVANQIAAGEVVERPASVVKELVENSLDAGAARIAVEILAAGRGLIRVTDDGSGMSRDDALLCLERHATSKIAAAADLARVTTMGFRGEAIPSIASVSRFTLTTRARVDADAASPGSRVTIHGGKILEVREAGSPAGTTVEVRNLFFNIPARRKFLRSDETERAHIQHWLTTAALAHPHVAFTLNMENRTVWQLAALPTADTSQSRLDSLRERLRLLLGQGLVLIAVATRGELAATSVAPADVIGATETSPAVEVCLWGWIGAPGVSRGTRDDQHIFVNRRPIENRGLNAALIEGYHNALMKGRYPLGCLFLEIDPGEVDVNIHPAKREVKFHRERAVRQFVAGAVREALKSWHDPSTSGAPREDSTVNLLQKSLADRNLRPSRIDPPAPIAAPPEPPPALVTRTTSSTSSHLPPTLGSPSDSGMPTSVPQDEVALVAPPSAQPPGSERAPSSDPVPLLAVPLRIVGVIGRLYVVLESDRGLVLLDQHAAHERVLYEQMLRRMEHGGSAPSQRLLLPETIELSPRDATFLRENLPALTRLGVGLSEFGERTFLLDALPPFVRSISPRKFGRELVDELRAAGATVNAWRLGETVVAKTVCRHAVKANDPLAGPELQALLDDLRRCDMPYTCPHGRPTLIEMSYRELEKKFGRIQG